MQENLPLFRTMRVMDSASWQLGSIHRFKPDAVDADAVDADAVGADAVGVAVAAGLPAWSVRTPGSEMRKEIVPHKVAGARVARTACRARASMSKNEFAAG